VKPVIQAITTVTVKLPDTIRRGMKFNDATFMGIMRWTLYQHLKEIYPNVRITYGYITKNVRIKAQLPKTHAIDALCIAGHPNAERAADMYYLKK